MMADYDGDYIYMDAPRVKPRKPFTLETAMNLLIKVTELIKPLEATKLTRTYITRNRRAASTIRKALTIGTFEAGVVLQGGTPNMQVAIYDLLRRGRIAESTYLITRDVVAAAVSQKGDLYTLFAEADPTAWSSFSAMEKHFCVSSCWWAYASKLIADAEKYEALLEV